MQNINTELNQEIKSLKAINISKIVGLVVSLLDNTKTSGKSSNAVNKNLSLIQCDICDFQSDNKKQRFVTCLKSIKIAFSVTCVTTTLTQKSP